MTEQEARTVLRTKFQCRLGPDPFGGDRYQIELQATKDVIAGAGYMMTLDDVENWIREETARQLAGPPVDPA